MCIHTEYFILDFEHVCPDLTYVWVGGVIHFRTTYTHIFSIILRQRDEKEGTLLLLLHPSIHTHIDYLLSQYECPYVRAIRNLTFRISNRPMKSVLPLRPIKTNTNLLLAWLEAVLSYGNG